MTLKSRDVILDSIVDADVVDLKARTLEHHGNKVLTDVVDVALHGTDDHGAHWLRTRLRQQGSENSHTPFHSICGEQHFRYEQDTIPEVDTDNCHTIDQRLSKHLLSGPASIEENLRTFLDFLFQSVIQVVVHL